MGTVSTLALWCAVWILAVAESPGRSEAGGLSSVTTTLKSRASWVFAVVAVMAAWPEVRKDGQFADFGDAALEDFARNGVDGDSAGLAVAHDW